LIALPLARTVAFSTEIFLSNSSIQDNVMRELHGMVR
jgi:hypothetical protein